MNRPRVEIVGGGFGGLSAAKKLSKSNVEITLIDKKNYHLFQPLLYQVAAGELSPADIAYPLRQLLGRSPNVKILLGEVIEVNKEEKWVRTPEVKIDFDYLILACGSTSSYFGHPEWERFAPALKSIPEATEIRRRVFMAFEEAERQSDAKKRDELLTFVVVGGGPTGVELAGALGKITRLSITKEFSNISPNQTRILLVEMGERVLAQMPPELSQEATRELIELGVEVRTSTKVEKIDEEGIRIGDEIIHTKTILWGAGVGANSINKNLAVPLDRQGRVIVRDDLSIRDFPDIYVIGDQAHFELNSQGQALPGLAPVAMQEGRFVAKNIIRKIHHKDQIERFIYIDKGNLATIGRSRAVGIYKNLSMSGSIAWFGWLAVHIYYLIGFKNRLIVLFQWFWTFITYRRGARLIIDNK